MLKTVVASRVAFSFLSIWVLIPLCPVLAQAQPDLVLGKRVRVTAPECWLHEMVGSFEGLRGDTLVFSTESDASSENVITACPLAHVTHLDVRRIDLSGGGALIGAAGGYLVALWIAFTIDSQRTGDIQWPYSPLVALIGVLPGASIGAGGSVGKGALIGLLAGFAAGPLLFYPIYCSGDLELCFDDGEFLGAWSISLAGGMFFGPIAGAAFGHLWHWVPLEHLSMSLDLRRHRTVGLRVAVHF